MKSASRSPAAFLKSRFTAIVNCAIACPLATYRSSGSLVRRPISSMRLSMPFASRNWRTGTVAFIMYRCQDTYMSPATAGVPRIGTVKRNRATGSVPAARRDYNGRPDRDPAAGTVLLPEHGDPVGHGNENVIIRRVHGHR